MNIRESITLLEDAEFNRTTFHKIRRIRDMYEDGPERTRLNRYMIWVGISDTTPAEISREYERLAKLHKKPDPQVTAEDVSTENTEDIWNEIKSLRDNLDDGPRRVDISNIMNYVDKKSTPESVMDIWLERANDIYDNGKLDGSWNRTSPAPDDSTTTDNRDDDNDSQRDVPAQGSNAVYKEVTGRGQGRRYTTFDADDNQVESGKGGGPRLPSKEEYEAGQDADGPRGRDQRDQPTRPGQDRSGPQRDRPTRPGQNRSGPTLSKIRRTLRRGNRGQAVKIAQQALGIPADGIFGPQTQRAVKQFQQRNGLQVDGIIGRQTLAALKNKNRTGKVGNVDTAPGRVSAAPQSSRRPQQKPTQNSSKINSSPVLAEGNNNMSNISRILQLAGTNKKPLNESQSLEECPPMDSAAMPTSEGSPVAMNVSLTASGKDHVNDLLSMMKAAGLDSAEPVSAKSISQIPDMDPSTMQDPKSSMSDPEEPEMGDYIRMISQEAEDDGGFEDATTEPDEEYSDIRASIPSGDDLSRSKKPYPPTDGGDNPMALEQKLKSKLAAALAEKKAKPDYIDIDGDGDTKEPMKKAAKDKKQKRAK